MLGGTQPSLVTFLLLGASATMVAPEEIRAAVANALNELIASDPKLSIILESRDKIIQKACSKVCAHHLLFFPFNRC